MKKRYLDKVNPAVIENAEKDTPQAKRLFKIKSPITEILHRFYQSLYFFVARNRNLLKIPPEIFDQTAQMP